MTYGPVLVVNPRSDDTFAALAERHVQACCGKPEELEHALRARYPHARVRERLVSDELHTTWYVYRDGQWIRSEA